MIRDYVKFLIVGVVCGVALLLCGALIQFVLSIFGAGYTDAVNWVLFSIKVFVGLMAGFVSAYLATRRRSVGRVDALKIGVFSGFITGFAYMVITILVVIGIITGRSELLPLMNPDLIINQAWLFMCTVLGVIGSLVFIALKKNLTSK